MPVYCYRDSSGRVHERHYPMGKAPTQIGVGRGRFAIRSIVAEQAGAKAPVGDLWPLHSDALGVAPSQREEAIAEAARVGIPTDYDHEGRAVLRSPKHRKELAEALGYYDRNGGYGDPQRGERCRIDKSTFVGGSTPPLIVH
jgi:hypothetical protein